MAAANRIKASLAALAFSVVGGLAGAASAQDDASLVQRGEYLAKAGDCAACHNVPGAKPYAGGHKFALPMGVIVSSNITPSKSFGIGNWTEAQFAKAIREGVSVDGRHLYPAMPYTSYSKVTDADMEALYAYFEHGVAPVDAAPAAKTKLSFPFNLPGTMAVWDALFLNKDRFSPDPKLTAEQNRGKYLVQGLAHCSTCHTPRNQMMAEEGTKPLAGAIVDRWHAPNITSDPVSGVGGWSKDDIVAYLKNGNAPGKGQAAGPMGEAVENSFRFMTDADLQAIAAYLKIVPAIHDPAQSSPAFAVNAAKPISVESFEPVQVASNKPGYADASTTNGAVLYDAACAACHGVNGQGSEDGHFPSLFKNTAVGASDPTNLVMAMADGLHRQGANGLAVMPAFSPQKQAIHSYLNEDQMAAIANYVTANFGKGDAKLDARGVQKILAGGDAPFLIKNAAVLAIVGILAGIAVMLLIGARLLSGKRRRAAQV
ncbi:MAG: c-type cytochrome [Caulobacteraceae bacterium]